MINNKARFIMLKRPIDEVISSKNLIDMENAQKITKTSDYRIYPISHEDLMEDGWEYPEEYDPVKYGRFRQGEYIGSKWGGKYLRAPDIFFTILEKGKDKLEKIENLFNVETYLNTGGADDFFIVKAKFHDEFVEITNSSEEWIGGKVKFSVEKEYVRTFIKSPRETTKIEISKDDSQWGIIIIPSEQSKIRDKKIMEYIKWGESVNFSNRSGCKNRKPWWRLPSQATNPGEIIWTRLHNEKHIVWFNPSRISYTNYYALWPKNKNIDSLYVALLLNSSLQCLFREIYGKANFGEGVLKTDGNDIKKMLCFDFNTMRSDRMLKLKDISNKISNRAVNSIFKEVGIDPSLPIRKQEPNPLPDRKDLDDIVFDEIGLTDGEKKEIYWNICELTKQRSDKANSLKKKVSR